MNVCFFVKQNTEYELRISDWSSDVCSSDLLLKASPALPLRIATVTGSDRDDRVARVRKVSADQLRMKDASIRVPRVFGDGIVPVADWIARTISGFASIPPVASSSAIISFHFSRFAPIRRTHSRSEEHTSELQSLMRI